MKTAIKPGFRFKNGIMSLAILCYAEKNDTNVSLLLSETDGLFVTVRNLNIWQGEYTWDWGHYFSDLSEALIDYNKRLKDL